MRPNVVTTVFSLLTVAGVLISSLARAQTTSATIKIGSMIPLSGSDAKEAPGLRNAVQLAAKQINANGGVGGKKIEIVTEDTFSDPASALKAYSKLIDEKHVTAIIAPFKSAQVIALVLKARKSNVPTIIGATNTRLTEDGNKWFFRTRANETVRAHALIAHLKAETKFKKIGIIHDNGALGAAGSNLLVKFAGEAGFQVVKNIGFDFGKQNFDADMKAVKDAGAEVVIPYAANLEEAGRLLAAYGTAGRPMYCLSTPAGTSQVALDIAKKNAEGVYGIVDVVFGTTAANRKYVADYKAEFNSEPEPIAAYGYDGLKLLTEAMATAGTDPEKIRQALLKLKNFEGVLGNYSFNENGDGLHQVSTVRVHDSKIEYLKTISVE